MNRHIVHLMMEKAARLAASCDNSVYPNPKIGAVIFDDSGTVIAEGQTQRYGGPHAEAQALQKAGSRARGMNMAVTLEPCNHYGKTPPCSLAIIDAGIKRVFIAKQEENPVATSGAERMRQAGVAVFFLPEYAPQTEELNRFFFTNIRKKRAWVTAKIARTANGYVAAARGKRTAISSPDSNRFVHQLRADHPAIAVGAGTVQADNPQLTVRLVDCVKQPLPVIYSASLHLPETAFLYNAHPIVFTEKSENSPQWHQCTSKGCRLEHCASDNLFQSLALLLENYRINALLLEGGPHLMRSFFRQNVVDECIVITAPNMPEKGYFCDVEALLSEQWKLTERTQLGGDTVERYRIVHS